jgi:hypothetical protein
MTTRVTRLVVFAGVLVSTVLVHGRGVAEHPGPQERFSLFHPSTQESVERMLTLAELRDDDVVVDLGSGNGLIPLTAARMNRRLRGWGVDINQQLVNESNQTALDEGLADRVRFYYQNAFDVDLSEATVVTMWLFPEFMRLLRPVILDRARPGTRVLTSTWNLGEWEPDETNSDGGVSVYKWIVPAKVGGAWQWTASVGNRQYRYSAFTEQHFQKVEGVVRVGDRREVLEKMTLRGEDVSFGLRITLDGLGAVVHEFAGKVRGNQIDGTMKVTPPERATLTLPWRAERTDRSDYFSFTGTALFEEPAATTP